MSRIPSIRRSYVVSQIGLIVVLLMAKTHNPSIRLCCDLFQMETRAVLMVLPDTISSELKIILEKIPLRLQVLSRSTTGVKVSSRSIITPIVSWLPGRQEGRHEGVNCMTKHWQGHYPLILLYALLPPQNTCICPTCTIHYKLLLLHALCQVLAGNHLQHAAWWRNQSRAAVLRLQTKILVLSI